MRVRVWGGAVLLVAGVLLTWGSHFVAGQVHDQLGMQGITMPTSLDGLPAADAAALQPFAGQPMTKGPQAAAYANHYILVHMNEGTDTLFKTLQGLGIDTTPWQAKAPLTYASVSSVGTDITNNASLTDDQKTQGTAAVTSLKNTLFQGNTLRGMLLFGYAFATIGTIAGIASIFAWIGAAVMLILTVLGFWHASRQQKSGAPAIESTVPNPANA